MFFNADECGLFYEMEPDHAISEQRPQGRKKWNTSSPFSSMQNNYGSEKFELMFIRTVLRSRPFKNKSGMEYGIDYLANQKAWMNWEIFQNGLARFDSHLTAKVCKVLLIIGNCSVHSSNKTLPSFKIVDVLFPPLSTAPKMQPCNSGIFASMKARYRTFQIKRAIVLSMQIRNTYRNKAVLTTGSTVVINTVISYAVRASVRYFQTVHSFT